MKVFDSGMPEETYWESLFDVELILRSLQIGPNLRDVAELGCGYGTFTIPVARAVSGTLYTFDIEPEMLARTSARVSQAGLRNVVCARRDVMDDGFELAEGSVDAVLLFNILHGEGAPKLLDRAAEVVRPGGWVLAIHWRHDQSTPRGPALDIRPTPEQIIGWAEQTGRLRACGPAISLPPWHYGLRLERV